MNWSSMFRGSILTRSGNKQYRKLLYAQSNHWSILPRDAGDELGMFGMKSKCSITKSKALWSTVPSTELLTANCRGPAFSSSLLFC